MPREFVVAARLTREEHRALKVLVGKKRPRVFIKDFVRSAVLSAMVEPQKGMDIGQRSGPA